MVKVKLELELVEKDDVNVELPIRDGNVTFELFISVEKISVDFMIEFSDELVKK